jgi:hypothetical protein
MEKKNLLLLHNFLEDWERLQISDSELWLLPEALVLK